MTGSESLVEKAERGQFGDLFRLDLFWGAPNHPPIEIELDDGLRVLATNVSSHEGVRVWAVPVLPGSIGEARVDQAVSKNSTNRLVIFHSGDKQVWRWPSRTNRGAGVVSRPARHVHTTGSADPQFVAKLEAIRLPSDSAVDVNELLLRVRGAFDVETKNETRRASKLMAQMYSAVEKGYASDFDPKVRDHEISVTLARVLFLLFGDDTEMWKSPEGEPMPDLFQDFVKDHCQREGADIAERLNDLFVTLDSAQELRNGISAELATFPYVNGGIFEERITLPELDGDFRNAILAASAVDWATISPAIFGSMFQSVRDAQTRRELGEHYTSEENILKTLKPLFLDELNADFDKIIGSAEALGGKRKKLNALWGRLGAIRFLDPACGCGNFIIVAYQRLRALELQIMDALATIAGGEESQTLAYDWTPMLQVTLDHFYGIEIDEWPARIAETAMFLVDRQCDLRMKERFGVAPERLPIQKSAKIVVGDALEVPWSTVVPVSDDVLIAGNPPFLGHISRSEYQTEQLRAAWDGADIGRLDYVTAWYATAMKYFGPTPGRWAFVSTNSVAQGDQVPRLFGPVFQAGWRIKFAHRTFVWTSEATGAAAVHCNIIGFDRSTGPARLFDYRSQSQPVEVEATNINGYLVDGPNVLVSPRNEPLSADLLPVTFGNMPRDGGHLIVDTDAYPAVAGDPVAARYLRRFIGSEELVNGTNRWCLWMPDLVEADIRKSPILAARIDGVRQMRLKSKAASTKAMASTPHLFGQRSGGYKSSYLGIPRVVSENRPFYTAGRLDADVIPSDRLFAAPDDDGFLFGVISSSMFITWQATVGNRLKSDLSFSNTLVWNNFPLPEIAKSVREEVIARGADVLTAREANGQRSLAALYGSDAIPDELQAAHAGLDAVVDRIFGLGQEVPTMEERQSALFASYVKKDAGLLAGLNRIPSRKKVSKRA